MWRVFVNSYNEKIKLKDLNDNYKIIRTLANENEDKKIYDLPIIKDYKEDKKQNDDLEL